jgi:hypothetical protein
MIFRKIGFPDHALAGDAHRAAPHRSPFHASMDSRHAARRERPSDFRLCSIDRQHDARCLRMLERHRQCAKHRTGRNDRAGERGFLVKCHHGIPSVFGLGSKAFGPQEF